MAKITVKQAVEPITPPELPNVADVVTNAIAPDIEDMIADQLLDDIDWQKVKQALIRKAPAKLFKWFQSQLLPSEGSPIICTEVEAMALGEGKTDD